MKLVVVERKDDFREKLDQVPLTEASDLVYKSLCPEKQAPLAKLLNHLTFSDEICKCGKTLRFANTEFTQWTILRFPDDQKKDITFNIFDLLHSGRREDVLKDYTCRYCKKKNTISRQNTYWVNFPNVLIMHISRFNSEMQTNGSAITWKVKNRVDFPEDNLDLSPFAVPNARRPGRRYDCFAVVAHAGNSLQGGHYTTYKRDLVKDGQRWNYKEWYHYDDQKVTKSSFNEIPREQAFILFYRVNMS